MGEQKETVGQYLKRQREARGISVREISRALNVGPALISVIEESDSSSEEMRKYYDHYARYVLNDPDELTRFYEGRKTVVPLAPPEGLSVPVAGQEFLPHLKSQRGRIFIQTHGRNIIAGSTVVVLFVTLFVGTSLYSNRRVSEAPKQAEEAVVSASQPVAPPAVPQAVPPAATQEAGALPKPVQDPAKPPAEELPRPVQDLATIPPQPVPKPKVIGNSDSKRYHLPGMKYYYEVDAYHRVEFDSEEDAIAAGYHKAPR
ncbi:MAG: helix-turn-helix domain-containing protein [Syntrophales bacterium]